MVTRCCCSAAIARSAELCTMVLIARPSVKLTESNVTQWYQSRVAFCSKRAKYGRS